MTVTKSPLEFLNTKLLQLHVDYVMDPVKNYTDKELIEITNKYNIDIDFATVPIDTELIKVYMKTNINNSAKIEAGYKISCECICVFRLSEKKLKKEEIQNLKSYSALYITLNTLRNYIADATAKFPLGMYLLPSIDLNELIKQKIINRKPKKGNIS